MTVSNFLYFKLVLVKYCICDNHKLYAASTVILCKCLGRQLPSLFFFVLGFVFFPLSALEPLKLLELDILQTSSQEYLH